MQVGAYFLETPITGLVQLTTTSSCVNHTHMNGPISEKAGRDACLIWRQQCGLAITVAGSTLKL